MRDNGDFFVKEEDLKTVGFKDLEVTAYKIEEEEYILLSSIRGVGFEFDEVSLSLEITALPSFFSFHSIDFARERPETVHYPKNVSGFCVGIVFVFITGR